jgi:signal transduction histidine kinase
VTALSATAYRPRVRMHPRTVGFDVVLALGLAATMLVELWQADGTDTRITPLSVTVVLAASAPVVLRRHRPGLALVLAMGALYAVMATVDIYQTVPFPSMVAGYSLALATDRRTTVLAGLALVPPVIGAVALFGHDDVLFRTAEIPKNLAFVAAPLLLGSAVRERRAAHAALVERAETAERTREEEARRRVGEERLRIARDVHDVVAHAMVAINVQAGVGAHLMDRDPERARQTLVDIKRVSGEALTDLRATLGAIRSTDDGAGDLGDGAPAPTSPTQSLADLADLGRSLRTAGVDVDLDIDPAVDPSSARVPAAVAATGYRIVQEALTNVVRHARGAHAEVRVALEDDRVVIEVTDDGRGEPVVGVPPPEGTGNGIRGMRERAEVVGGSVEAGPSGDGGWRVRAELPVDAASAGSGVSGIGGVA